VEASAGQNQIKTIEHFDSWKLSNISRTNRVNLHTLQWNNIISLNHYSFD
jgi:hypothetical protein